MILNRRRLYMLPTRNGVIFALVVFVMLLAATNYNNGMIYALTFMLASLALVSMLHTHRNLSGVDVSIAPSRPVFAGDAALFRLAVQNHRDFERVSVWVCCAGHRQHISIPPAQTVVAEVPVVTDRRGHIRCPGMRLTSAYPFGLLYTWSAAVTCDTPGLVYPKPFGTSGAPPATGTDRFIESGSRVEGDDFIGLREYHEGDPPRHVHWKASAVNGRLLTKQFGGEGGGEVWLDWADTVGPVDARLSQLTRWVLDAEQANTPYGLRMPGFNKTPGLGAEHRHRCLMTLALWDLDDQPR